MSFAFWYLFTATIFAPHPGCGPGRAAGWFADKTLGDLERELAIMESKTLASRIDLWSKRFMGISYGIDPAGEERAPDADPVFNVCAVDCETYVEQVLALSFSKNVKEMRHWLERMRYEGGVREYRHRFYTMALQWIPANLRLGYLKGAHALIGGPRLRMIKDIDPGFAWAPVFRRRFQELGSRAPRGRASITYLSLKTLMARTEKIPVPAVGLVVGARQIRNPFLITHMGFILRDQKGNLIWRHASGTPHRYRVEDRPLTAYLKETDIYFKQFRRRHVKGMMIYSVVMPPRDAP